MACPHPQMTQSCIIILWKYLEVFMSLNKFPLDKKKRERERRRRRRGKWQRMRKKKKKRRKEKNERDGWPRRLT